MQRYLFFAAELYALSILRPLQAAIQARGDKVAWFFAGPGADWLHADECRLHTVREVRAFAPAAVFVPGNWVPDFFPGLKIEVFHGFSVHKRSLERGHFRIRGLFDLYCTQGPDTTEPFRQLAAGHGHFRVVETGWPKMDPLFATTPPRPTRHDLPVVLYASTFTPAISSAPHLFETIDGLSRRGDRHWLVTLHPKMRRDWIECFRAMQHEHLEFVESDDIVPLLKSADVLVSDTSSVASEFLLRRKPVVTFRNRKPGPHLLDVGEPAQLDAAIATALAQPEALMAAIAAYGDRIHPHRDGRSSERVLAAVDQFQSYGLKRKPLNLMRKLQARRRLGYYRLR
ncbi:MAG TPA: CDP-glycerol glycerophosphotransferase family protein [Gammaproteobacteria bacterium]|nr:CDP-glycerol glycerophosphotransferase family protein [Gammaproteobacteria bacterium]